MKKLIALLLVLAGLSVAAFAAEKGPKPAVIAQGQRIELSEHLVAGKTTVVDFTSEYCPPCRVYAEPLNELHAARADLAVVKVDINRPGVQKIDWSSPVADQFELKSIPHFKVYGPDGKLLAEGKEARAMVDRWIAGKE